MIRSFSSNSLLHFIVVPVLIQAEKICSWCAGSLHMLQRNFAEERLFRRHGRHWHCIVDAGSVAASEAGSFYGKVLGFIRKSQVAWRCRLACC